MDILEAMRMRRSERTYLDKSVSEDLLKQLLEVFDKSHRLNTIGLRLITMDPSLVEHAMTGLIGSYGRIKNAPVWVIGISQEGQDHQAGNTGQGAGDGLPVPRPWLPRAGRLFQGGEVVRDGREPAAAQPAGVRGARLAVRHLPD